MEIIKYENYDLTTIVERIPEKIRDDLPFGLVKLDLAGNILEYNMAEAELTGFRPEEVVGRNFFLDVATCTQTPEFYGKFREGVDKGLVNVQFDYMFDTNMIPTTVRVRMVQMHDVVWMTVRRLNKQCETVDITRAPGYVAHSQPDQFLSPHEAMPSHEQAQIAAASGPSWMPPPRNVLDPQYVNNATMQLRGTLAHASQLPPTSPPAGSWPSDDEARAWAMEQAARVRANWASAAASAHAQPRPPHVVSAPVAPQPASFNPPAPPRVAQKARRTDERGLEAFDFNA